MITTEDPLRVAAVELDLTAAFARALGAPYVPGRRGLALAPEALLADLGSGVIDLVGGQRIDPTQLTVVENPVLSRWGLAAVRYPSPDPGLVAPTERDSRLLRALRVAILEEERVTLGRAVRWCQDFLSSRRTGGHKLSTHPNVAYQMAALVAAASALAAVDLPATLGTEAGRGWLVCNLDEAHEQLTRMVGGRSMLAGNMVQLRAVTLTVNRLYIGRGTCSN